MNKLITLLVALLLCQSAPAAYNNSTIEKNINYIIKKIDPNINIGIVVHSNKANKDIVTINQNRAYVPASTLKILTAISSLLYLGPSYHFQTSFYFNPKKVKNHQLQDDLYVKFSGDPEFTKKELNHMILKLKKAGINRINGRVYIDANQFSGKPFGPGWMWDDQQSCYSAPLSAVILNRNCAVFTIETYKNKKKAEIKNNFDLKINNQLYRSKSSRCHHEISANKKNDYYFSGCIYPGKHVLEISVNNPEYYVKQYLSQLFRKNRVSLRKNISTRDTPSDLKPQITHRSPALSELVKTMLKDSDNLIADSLLKTLGARYYKRPGNWRNGVKAIRAIVKKKLNVNLKKSMIVDGAGLSRYNLIRPKQLVDLLARMKKYPKLLRTFRASLPIAGKDGTLKYRFRKSNTDIYAKTGTMNGVTSLAGYIKTERRDTLSFAIIINGIVGKTTRYKRLEEKLCQYLAGL